MREHRLIKKIGIVICFIVAVVIAFTCSGDKILDIRHVNGTACEGSFITAVERFVMPFSDFEFDESKLSEVQFTISDDVFEASDFLTEGMRIERPVYKYWKEAFYVTGGKVYVMTRDTENSSNVDLSAYGTRIALKVFDKGGNDTGYIVYNCIDGNKQSHIFIGQILQNDEDDGNDNRVHLFLELANADDLS